MNETKQTRTPLALVAERIPSRMRMDALLEMPGAREYVQELDAYALHGLLMEVGLSDALDLALLASQDQVQRFIDFDAWRKDAFDPGAFGVWLGIYMDGLELEDFGRLLESLDTEILPLFLKAHIQVFMAEDGLPPDNAPENVESSPDYKYFIQYPEDEDTGRFCRKLIKKVYDSLGVMIGWRTLESVRWELQTEMEILAYQFRNQRLEEHGFRSVDEAAALYAPINPVKIRDEAAAILAGQDPSKSGGVTTTILNTGLNTGPADIPIHPHFLSVLAEDESKRQGFFARVMGLLDDATWRVVTNQLSTLGNMAASAEAIEPGDRKGAANAFRIALSYLDVGLTYISRQQPEDAAKLLGKLALRRVVQVGHGLVRGLAKQSQLIGARGRLSLVEGQPYSLLTDTERSLMEGLSQRRPIKDATAALPFWSLAEVEAAAASLALIAFQEGFFFDVLKFDRAELAALVYQQNLNVGPEAAHFDNLVATFIVQQRLRKELLLLPLDAQELRALLASLTDDPTAQLAALVDQWFGRFQQPEAVATVKRWRRRITTTLTEELGGLCGPAKTLDPRFISCVLIHTPADASPTI